MRIGITGTPGTGKTTVSKLLTRDVIDLKKFAQERGLGEEKKIFHIDVESLDEELPEDCCVEGHLAHRLTLDYCIILRTRPDVLEERLRKRDYPEEKIRENVEAEAMDLILSQASNQDFTVYEIDTTDVRPGTIAERIEEAIEKKEERKGVVDWSSYI